MSDTDGEVTSVSYGERFRVRDLSIAQPLRLERAAERHAKGGRYYALVERSDVPGPVVAFVSGMGGVVSVSFYRPDGSGRDHELIYACEPFAFGSLRLKQQMIIQGGDRDPLRVIHEWAIRDDGMAVRMINSEDVDMLLTEIEGIDPHRFDEVWPAFGDFERITRPGRPLWDFGEPPLADVIASSGSPFLQAPR